MQQKYLDLLAVLDTDVSAVSVSDIFTPEEVTDILETIREYKENPRSRSGGSAIQKELELLKEFIRKNNYVLMLRHAEALEALLHPVKRSAKQSQIELIKSMARSYVNLDESTLRVLAAVMLHDGQLDYTYGELPYAIAYFQITKKAVSLLEIPAKEEW